MFDKKKRCESKMTAHCSLFNNLLSPGKTSDFLLERHNRGCTDLCVVCLDGQLPDSTANMFSVSQIASIVYGFVASSIFNLKDHLILVLFAIYNRHILEKLFVFFLLS